MNWQRYKQYAPLVLRFGLSIVFLWFGIHQFLHPEWFMGYVPAWIYATGLQPSLVLLLNGMLDTVLGALLLIGIYTRAVAFLASIHLMGVILGLGYNDIAVRDVGLLMATTAVMLHGPDNWCLEKRRKWR